MPELNVTTVDYILFTFSFCFFVFFFFFVFLVFFSFLEIWDRISDRSPKVLLNPVLVENVQRFRRNEYKRVIVKRVKDKGLSNIFTLV